LINMKTPFHSVLESLALALIFTPEPTTTIAGIGLLSLTRTMRCRKGIRRNRLTNGVEGYYTYRIDMVDGRTITFQVFPIRQGQLSLTWPNIGKLYSSPEAWEAFRAGANQASKATPSPVSGLRQASLLRTPKRGSYARLFAPAHNPYPQLSR